MYDNTLKNWQHNKSQVRIAIYTSPLILSIVVYIIIYFISVYKFCPVCCLYHLSITSRFYWLCVVHVFTIHQLALVSRTSL